MRRSTICCAMLGLILAMRTSILWGASDNKTQAERIARLIEQLGDDSFDKREAASKELESIGEPARAALQKATSDGDLEIRRRAEDLLGVFGARLAKKQREQLQGKWYLVSYEVGGKQIKGETKNDLFVIDGDNWETSLDGRLSQKGTIGSVEPYGDVFAIDLPITGGGNAGATAYSIFKIEGDTLKYLNAGLPRPSEFTTKPGDGRCFLTYRRVKP